MDPLPHMHCLGVGGLFLRSPTTASTFALCSCRLEEFTNSCHSECENVGVAKLKVIKKTEAGVHGCLISAQVI